MTVINDLSKKYGGIIQVNADPLTPNDLDAVATHYDLFRCDGESDESLQERISLAMCSRRMDLMQFRGLESPFNLPSGDQK